MEERIARPLSWQVYVAGVCVILGILLVAQIRTQEYIGTNVIPTRRLEDLTDMLRKTEREKESLQGEVSLLREQVARLMEGEHAREVVRDELEKARMAAGLVEVRGPGVIVILDDSKKHALPGESAELFLIHDEDILKTVNELFAAGAEAVAVNDQRIVATTEIRCAGPTISVNNTRISPPYKITAIGDPATLDGALKMRDGIADTLRAWGIQVKVTQQPEVVVPSYKGSIFFQYAKPVESAGSR